MRFKDRRDPRLLFRCPVSVYSRTSRRDFYLDFLLRDGLEDDGGWFDFSQVRLPKELLERAGLSCCHYFYDELLWWERKR